MSESKTLRRLRRLAIVRYGRMANVVQEGNHYFVTLREWENDEGVVIDGVTTVGKDSAARLRKLLREGK